MKLGRQWEERLKIWDEAFLPNIYRPLGTVELEGFTTREQLCPEQAAKRERQAFPRGRTWGAKWEYGWFHARLTLPRAAEGERILLHLAPGPEMLVYVDGREAGSIDAKHDFVELTPRAQAGQVFEIWAEVYAGHGPRLEGGGIFTREAVPVPEPPENQCSVGESHFGIQDPVYFQIYADYHTLYELWKALPESSLRGMKIGRALQEFTFEADFEAQEPARRESVLRAGSLLKPLLEKRNSETAVEYTVFGQSHLDLAWLWPWEETKRKCVRTYANQLALMDRYPEYQFLLCEPPILENLKEYYPGLYRRVKERVETGQFLPEGAVYIESDTNLAGGESLIRQFVLGKRWFRQELNADSRMAWMPDTFGFTGALPQIMAGCGVSYFATQKLLRADPECQQFPYNIFWWEGIDGTRILSHIYKKNNAVFAPGALIERWEKDRNQRQDIDSLMFPFGYGDGGGGPTELMVETALRCRDLEGLPRCRLEGPAAFFDRISPSEVRNVYYGELYLAWHRGTYTTQAGIKKGVRRAEYALREAEYLAGLLRLSEKAVEERDLDAEAGEKLAELWKKLLFQEFHDILPGTSIHRVNREALEALEQVEQESRELAEKLLERLAGGRAVFNSLSWERSWKGNVLPACGYMKLQDNNEGIEVSRRPDGTEAVSRRENFDGKGGLQIQNSFYLVEMDREGRIFSLKDRSTGYEYAEGPLNHFRLYRDVNVDYDAWELGRMYEETEEAFAGETAMEVRQEGRNLVVALHRQEPHFAVDQQILFLADTPRIGFQTQVDWRERHRILKVDFPTTVYTKEALEEIQFGYLKRPAHRSRQYEQDLYETCHHKYAALTDGKNGFALLNDCKYGISARDSRLSLTLLRAPVLPDMEADQGVHVFSYGILPFSGPFVYSRVPREAYEWNVQPVETTAQTRPFNIEETHSMEGEHSMDRFSFFEVEGDHVILETCKPAFDTENGVVLRLYESMGCAGRAFLRIPACVKRAYACNMLEERQQELEIREGRITLDFGAFQIQTLLLEIEGRNSRADGTG